MALLRILIDWEINQLVYNFASHFFCFLRSSEKQKISKIKLWLSALTSNTHICIQWLKLHIEKWSVFLETPVWKKKSHPNILSYFLTHERSWLVYLHVSGHSNQHLYMYSQWLQKVAGHPEIHKKASASSGKAEMDSDRQIFTQICESQML